MPNYEVQNVPGGELASLTGSEEMTIVDDTGVSRFVRPSTLKTFINTNPTVVPSGNPRSHMRLSKAGPQSITGGVLTALTWAQADVDTDSLFTIGTPTRLLAKSGATLVQINVNLELSNPSNNRVEVQVHKNGAAFPGMASLRVTSNSAPTYVNISTGVVGHQPGDYFEVLVNPGVNLDVVNSNNTWAAIQTIEE